MIALAALGLITLLSLVRLRAGWLNGVMAMNQIKKYYERIYPAAHLEKALVWRKLPSATKRDSVAFYTALSVVLVDSAMLGLGVIFVMAFRDPKQYMDEFSLSWGAVFFVGAIAIQLLTYHLLMRREGQDLLAQIAKHDDWSDLDKGDTKNAASQTHPH